MPGLTPFEVRLPEADQVPVLVSIPHTGVRVPEEVAATLAGAEMAALPMTDWHLHKLYDFLPGLGITSIHAVYSRFVVDLNRSPRAAPLYPGRFETGLVPTETFQGEPVFRQPPSAEDIERRRRRYHTPYHDELLRLLKALRRRFGFAVLIDAHSVASDANRLHGALTSEIYLGDRDGQTCAEWLRNALAEGFAEQGLQVVVNQPYKGGYITDHYGRMEEVDAIQVEMCQRVYMDEDHPAEGPESPRFTEAGVRLRRVFEGLLARLDTRVA